MTSKILASEVDRKNETRNSRTPPLTYQYNFRLYEHYWNSLDRCPRLNTHIRPFLSCFITFLEALRNLLTSEADTSEADASQSFWTVVNTFLSTTSQVVLFTNPLPYVWSETRDQILGIVQLPWIDLVWFGFFV